MTFQSQSSKSSIGQWIRLFFCGLCMGAADLVPGISGGTIAFIMGFYENLIESLKTLNFSSLKLLLTFQFKQFSNVFAWRFLIPLVSGIATAFILLAGLLYHILGDAIFRVYLYAGFFGLIVASFVFCAKQLKKWQWKHLGVLVLGAMVAHLLTGTALAPDVPEKTYAIQMTMPASSTKVKNYDPERHLLTGLTPPMLGALVAKSIIGLDAPIFSADGVLLGNVSEVFHPYRGWGIDMWLVFCGALAITAMLLPGISGSYLLTLLGVYAIVIGSLVDFIEAGKHLVFDQDAFFILFSLFVGIVVGLLVFVRCISWLLKYHHGISIAVLVGFMIGSLRSVWPFWSYEYVLDPLKLSKGVQLVPLEMLMPEWTSFLFFGAIICSIGGFFLVFSIESLASAKEDEKKLGKKDAKPVS